MRSRGGRRRSPQIVIEASGQAGSRAGQGVFNVRLPHTSSHRSQKENGKDRWTEADAKKREQKETCSSLCFASTSASVSSYSFVLSYSPELTPSHASHPHPCAKEKNHLQHRKRKTTSALYSLSHELNNKSASWISFHLWVVTYSLLNHDH